jgi:hypothetical protein
MVFATSTSPFLSPLNCDLLFAMAVLNKLLKSNDNAAMPHQSYSMIFKSLIPCHHIFHRFFVLKALLITASTLMEVC